MSSGMLGGRGRVGDMRTETPVEECLARWAAWLAMDATIRANRPLGQACPFCDVRPGEPCTAPPRAAAIALQGAFTNGPSPRPLTLAGLLETRRRLDALPRVPSAITVSPSIARGLQVGAIFDGMPPPFLVTVHVDERLPDGAWHEGKPRPEAPTWPGIEPGAEDETLHRPHR